MAISARSCRRGGENGMDSTAANKKNVIKNVEKICARWKRINPKDGLVVKPEAFSNHLRKSGQGDQSPGTSQHSRKTRQAKNEDPQDCG
jgi:hypothetical protein